MATHPVNAESEALIRVRRADRTEAEVIGRYELLRAGPDGAERRAVTAELERLCHFRGPLVHAGRTYSYDRREQVLYRSPRSGSPLSVRYGPKPGVPRAGAAGTKRFPIRKGG